MEEDNEFEGVEMSIRIEKQKKCPHKWGKEYDVEPASVYGDIRTYCDCEICDLTKLVKKRAYSQKIRDEADPWGA
jgi:hypothetical protein